MIVARLIDTEGQTIANLALPDDPERPRWYVYAAVPPRACVSINPVFDPTEINMQTLEYRLERRDGGGTFIYRRVTPLWQ